MELKKRQDDTLAEVTSIEVKADGMVISAKADMPSYGKVRFSINVQSSGERNSGACFGSGRGSTADGNFLAGIFSGRWHREGPTAFMNYIVEVSNGDRNLDMVEFDSTTDQIKIQHFALN